MYDMIVFYCQHLFYHARVIIMHMDSCIATLDNANRVWLSKHVVGDIRPPNGSKTNDN